MTRNRRFAIDTPLLPVFNYQLTTEDLIMMERISSAIDKARLLLGIRPTVMISMMQRAPDSITFRQRGWGYNMTAPILRAGLGKVSSAHFAPTNFIRFDKIRKTPAGSRRKNTNKMKKAKNQKANKRGHYAIDDYKDEASLGQICPNLESSEQAGKGTS